jgi:hypothetical protein
LSESLPSLPEESLLSLLESLGGWSLLESLLESLFETSFESLFESLFESSESLGGSSLPESLGRWSLPESLGGWSLLESLDSSHGPQHVPSTI